MRLFSTRKSKTVRSFGERLTLSPLEKFRKQGKWPFKLIFHVLVLIFSTTFLVAHNAQFAYYQNFQTTSITTLLQLDSSSTFPYFTQLTSVNGTNGILPHLQQCVTGYFSFSTTSVSKVVTTPELTLHIETSLGNTAYTLTPAEPMGPATALMNTDPVAFVQNLHTMSVEYFFGTRQIGGLIEDGPFLTLDYE